MNKHKFPDFITNTNFNGETLGLLEFDREFLKKVSMQYTFQSIIDFFRNDKNLEEISLDVSEKYNSSGAIYFDLTVNFLLKEDDGSYDDFSHQVYVCMMKYIDDKLLFKMMDGEEVILRRDDLGSYKLFAGILFGGEKYVEEYFDVLSKDNGRMSIDCITSKNINSFDTKLIAAELVRLHDLDCEVAILAVKKLFDIQDLNALEIRVGMDIDGYLHLIVNVDLHNGDLRLKGNIKVLLGDVFNQKMIHSLFGVEVIKIERNDVLGIKKLVDVLFKENDVSNNFLIVLQREALEFEIKNKKDNFFSKKFKI